jgi:TusA-related sulfurtransferase
MMTSTSHLNLVGVAWPVCLLKLKSVLNGLCSCDVLEVLAQDPDVVNNIIMIVDRSDDTLIEQHKTGEVYRLSIQKGA